MAECTKLRGPTKEEKLKLRQAIENGNDSAITSLVKENSIDINANIASLKLTRYMALHAAVKHRNLDIVKLLVEKLGADITQTDNNLMTPLDYAIKLEQWDIAHYFRKMCRQDISQLRNMNWDDIDHQLNQYERTHYGGYLEEEAYRRAFKKGMAGSLTVQMLMFGSKSSGKTSLLDTLLDENTSATKEEETKFCIIDTDRWQKCTLQDIAQRLQDHYSYHLSAKANEHAAVISLQDQCFSSSSPSLRGAAVSGSLKYDIMEAKKFEDKHTKFPRHFCAEQFYGVILDFSGQTHHLTTNSIFVHRNSVVFIVFKASSDLSDIVKEVCHWLQTVYSVSHKDARDHYMSILLPTAVLIATHTDEITGDVAEVKRGIIAKLTNVLLGKPYAKHLVGYRLGIEEALRKYCFLVSNKHKEKEIITQLRKIVCKIFLPLFNEKHPLVYLKIEKALYSSQKRIVSTADFHKITTNNGFIGEETSDEFKTVLKYFHDKGTILHFLFIPGLENVVFLSPWLLAKFLSYLTTTRWYSSPTGSKNGNGILLTEKHFSLAIQKHNDIFGCAMPPEEVIDFFVKLGFIAKVNVDSRFAKENTTVLNEEKLFLIPLLIPERTPQCRKMEKEFHWSVYFTFPDEFLPPIVFHQIVSECVKWSQSRNEGIEWLQHSEILMTLDSGQFYGVKFSPENSRIYLDILFQKAQPFSTENRVTVLEFLKSELDAICKKFMPVCTPPIAYVCCHNCSTRYIKLDDLKKKSLIPCKDSCVCNDEEYYHDLLFTGGITDTTQPTSPVEDVFYCDAAEKKLVSQYDNLCHMKQPESILRTLLPSLYTKRVVTTDQKIEIEHRQKQYLDGMQCLIDNVLIPSLNEKMKNKYKGFLAVMEESDDETLYSMARKLAVYDYAAPKEKLESEYNKICALPIGALLPTLFAKQVVTEKDIKRIKNRDTLEGNGMKYFIDNVILPTLANNKEKYRDFLEVMEKSGDEHFQHMANKLGGFQSIP